MNFISAIHNTEEEENLRDIPEKDIFARVQEAARVVPEKEEKSVTCIAHYFGLRI